ncbi:ankyrin repeat domain-containing protein [uncultured Rubinisphaera sp.]|uniref:ankyrin repeat domain-containing protein n=1 Tax=uncultured Rubinisphaera sp. TaxID=1678686 RepID=UPI0030D9D563
MSLKYFACFIMLASCGLTFLNDYSCVALAEEASPPYPRFNLDLFDEAETRQLCRAIQENDIVEVKRLIASGVDVNTAGAAGVTPLVWAFGQQNLTAFELLLNNGASPNIRLTNSVRENDPPIGGFFTKGNPLIHYAANGRFTIEYLKLMLKHGADPDLLSARHMPPIVSAIFYPWTPDKLERVKMIAAAGADLDLVYKSYSNTALAVAINDDRFDIALLLLDLGADPNLSFSNGRGNYAAVVTWKIGKLFDQYTDETQQQLMELKKRLQKAGLDLENAAQEVRLTCYEYDVEFPLLPEEKENLEELMRDLDEIIEGRRLEIIARIEKRTGEKYEPNRNARVAPKDSFGAAQP